LRIAAEFSLLQKKFQKPSCRSRKNDSQPLTVASAAIMAQQRERRWSDVSWFSTGVGFPQSGALLLTFQTAIKAS
jgi:hypothetical protein